MEYSIAVQTYCGLKSASALLNHLWCPARWFASRHLIVASAAAGFIPRVTLYGWLGVRLWR